jgi:transcriptional regulator with PAS, ATPase and Fis domain
MARARTIAAELAKLLDAAAQPIYVLDDEQTLVFCNRACLDWVGSTADDLVGRPCAYHSSAEVTGPDAVAAGLCPSPEVLAGRQMTGAVACADADGRLRRRRARFLPLSGGGDDTVGLIALVDEEDLPDSEVLSQSEPPPATADEPETARLHEQIRTFRAQVAARFREDRLLGESAAMRRARAQVALAVESKASVLIVGPPGSGRQHAARAIHHGSTRPSTGSMIPLACSVLGAELIQSTVAALAVQKPAPEQVRPTTLLLNDADQLPAEVQPEMAGVLGGKSFPLRLIATAGQPLDDLARRGQYREDLAAVLSTIVIELPPLAERRADIPLLAQMFLEEANSRGTKQVAGFSSEALDCLDRYPWPGNLDELAQIVAQAHKRAEGVQIAVTDLPERIHLAEDAASYPRRPEETIVLDQFLGGIERELIRRALAEAKGNKTKAAKLLGMTRARFHRRVTQLGLEK